MDDPRWNHRQVIAGDLRFHLVEEGDGPVVLLLHGFPEFWYSWRYQIPHLAAAGFRVLAPDLRGYNLSEKPVGVRACHIDRLVEDVAALVEWSGQRAVHLVGHDWGGIIAWYVAMHRPDLVRRLAILNAPHPEAWLRECRRSDQRRRSWYGALFQVPLLPELLLRVHNYEGIARAISEDCRNPDARTPEVLDAYRRAAAEPGAMTVALNYYRALARPWARAALDRRCPIDAETLLVWGLRDRFLSPGNAEELEAWVPRIRVECVPDASHWVQIDEPALTNQLLVDFLAAA